jgi:hypothetical protein
MLSSLPVCLVERGLRVLEVLRKIFWPKREGVTGEWRRIHNQELYDLYGSPDIMRMIKLRRMRLAGHVARVGDRRDAYRVLVGRCAGNRSLGGPMLRSKYNIKMDLTKSGMGSPGLELSRSG